MPVDEPYNVYRERLSSLYLGYALWKPEPVKRLYDKVSIGDVGYVCNGFFYRMFNVTRPWDHPSNQKFRASKPDHYEPMKEDDFDDIHEFCFKKGDYYSPGVSIEDNTEYKWARNSSDSEGYRYRCQGPGALLSLPRDGQREDAIRTKAFQYYIRDNVVSWFNWSKSQNLPVDAMEELILVTGCTLVDAWAAAAFVGRTETAEISLVASRTPDKSDIRFECRSIQGDVAQHYHDFDSNNSSPTRNQCVFFRGFRAKRRLFRTVPIQAAAEALPDDPDNNREDEIQVTRVPDAPKYRDPLIGVLDYIVEGCPEGTIAIAHDNDLLLVKNVGNLTADAVENSLRENQIPVLVENGAAMVLDQNNETAPVPYEKKMTPFDTEEFEGWARFWNRTTGDTSTKSDDVSGSSSDEDSLKTAMIKERMHRFEPRGPYPPSKGKVKSPHPPPQLRSS